MDQQMKATLNSSGLTDEEIAVGAALGLDFNQIIALIATYGPAAIAIFKSAVALVKQIIGQISNPPVVPPAPTP